MFSVLFTVFVATGSYGHERVDEPDWAITHAAALRVPMP